MLQQKQPSASAVLSSAQRAVFSFIFLLQNQIRSVPFMLSLSHFPTDIPSLCCPSPDG